MERIEQNKRSISESYGGNPNDSNAGQVLRKFRGVFPAGKKFRAVMQLDGVRHNLGMYTTEVEAAHAYDVFAKNNYKKTNFPQPPGPGHADSTAPASGPIATAQSTRVIDRLNYRPRAQTSAPRRQKFPSFSVQGSDAASTTAGAPLSYPAAAQNGYGGGFPPATTGYSDQSYQIYQVQDQYGWSHGQHLMFQPPHRQDRQPSYQDWQQPHWQQGPSLPVPPPHLYQQRLHDPYLPQPQMTPSAPHPIVYMPVPLPIADAVQKYVDDYYLAEQQKMHIQQHHVPQRDKQEQQEEQEQEQEDCQEVPFCPTEGEQAQRPLQPPLSSSAGTGSVPAPTTTFSSSATAITSAATSATATVKASTSASSSEVLGALKLRTFSEQERIAFPALTGSQSHHSSSIMSLAGKGKGKGVLTTEAQLPTFTVQFC